MSLGPLLPQATPSHAIPLLRLEEVPPPQPSPSAQTAPPPPPGEPPQPQEDASGSEADGQDDEGFREANPPMGQSLEEEACSGEEDAWDDEGFQEADPPAAAAAYPSVQSSERGGPGLEAVVRGEEERAHTAETPLSGTVSRPAPADVAGDAIAEAEVWRGGPSNATEASEPVTETQVGREAQASDAASTRTTGEALAGQDPQGAAQSGEVAEMRSVSSGGDRWEGGRSGGASSPGRDGLREGAPEAEEGDVIEEEDSWGEEYEDAPAADLQDRSQPGMSLAIPTSSDTPLQKAGGPSSPDTAAPAAREFLKEEVEPRDNPAHGDAKTPPPSRAEGVPPLEGRSAAGGLGAAGGVRSLEEGAGLGSGGPGPARAEGGREVLRMAGNPQSVGDTWGGEASGEEHTVREDSGDGGAGCLAVAGEHSGGDDDWGEDDFQVCSPWIDTIQWTSK